MCIAGHVAYDQKVNTHHTLGKKARQLEFSCYVSIGLCMLCVKTLLWVVYVYCICMGIKGL